LCGSGANRVLEIGQWQFERKLNDCAIDCRDAENPQHRGNRALRFERAQLSSNQIMNCRYRVSRK